MTCHRFDRLAQLAVVLNRLNGPWIMMSCVLIGALIMPGSAGASSVDALAPLAGPCPTDPARCIMIDLHVVEDDQGPCVSLTWLEQQLDTARRLFASSNVDLRVRSIDALPPKHWRVRSRTDRDALGRTRADTRGLHVFVVGRLANVDAPGDIRGVHWRDRTQRSRRWIILSSQAPSFVLAHELGHYFGLPHSSHPASIMNKRPRKHPPWGKRRFVRSERARMKKGIQRVLRRQGRDEARRFNHKAGTTGVMTSP